MCVGCLCLVVYMCLLVASVYVSVGCLSLYVPVGCLSLVVYMCVLVVFVW